MITELPEETATTSPESAAGPILGLLAKLTSAWGREAEGETTARTLGRELSRILPCDRALLLAMEDGASDLRVADVYQPARAGLRPGDLLKADSRTRELLEGGLDVAVSADTRLWADGLERALAQEHIGSCICLVLRWGREPVGLLVVCSRRPLAYAPAHLRALQQIAPALGAHLWRARQRRTAGADRSPSDDEREWVLMAVVGGLAHQFSNALAFLLGGMELLPRAQMDEQTRCLVERMETRILEASQTVRALQQFAGDAPPERLERVELAGLVEEVIDLSRPVWELALRADGRSVSIHHEPVEGLAAQGNRHDLKEAVLNILFNAVEALPEGGEIWITEGSDGLWTFIEIADTGVGMPVEVLRRARDPFFTTRPGLRQGLGLSVASGIARRHGGEATITSEAGKGAVVRLSLLGDGPATTSAPQAHSTEIDHHTEECR